MPAIESGYKSATTLLATHNCLANDEVANLSDTLQKAKAAGVTVLVPPFASDKREAAVVQFPGGYVAEIHAVAQ